MIDSLARVPKSPFCVTDGFTQSIDRELWIAYAPSSLGDKNMDRTGPKYHTATEVREQLFGKRRDVILFVICCVLIWVIIGYAYSANIEFSGPVHFLGIPLLLINLMSIFFVYDYFNRDGALLRVHKSTDGRRLLDEGEQLAKLHEEVAAAERARDLLVQQHKDTDGSFAWLSGLELAVQARRRSYNEQAADLNRRQRQWLDPLYAACRKSNPLSA